MEKSLFDGLVKSAGLYPDKIVLRHGQRQISYRDLRDQSERLADYLLQNGVTAGQNVAILMEPSIPAIIAVFGVLRAGACYIPLDCSAPPERWAMIIRDCRPGVIVCSARSRQAAELIDSDLLSLCKVITLKQIDAAGLLECVCEKPYPVHRGPDENVLDGPVFGQTGDSGSLPAFILYAPGADGQPKGACYTHGAAISFVAWALDYFKISSEDVFACQGALHFVISIFDIYVGVGAGATLCLAPRTLLAFPASLVKLIQEEKITTWFSVPSVLVPMVQCGVLQKHDLSRLRRLLFGGEEFPIQELAALTRQLPDVHCYNVYGQTETNLCMVYALPKGVYTGNQLPLGKPCKGVNACLLDEQGSPLEGNLSGELAIHSPRMMAGYFRNDVLNDTSFVNSSAHGGRLFYRTGDWLWRNPEDGNFIYVGRRDKMIKLRGHRTEKSEVEHVLMSHPKVAAAVVRKCDKDNEPGRLKAFVKLLPGASVPVSELRALCKRKLPKYMIPGSFRFMSSFPRLPEGKINRGALRQNEPD